MAVAFVLSHVGRHGEWPSPAPPARRTVPARPAPGLHTHRCRLLVVASDRARALASALAEHRARIASRAGRCRRHVRAVGNDPLRPRAKSTGRSVRAYCRVILEHASTIDLPTSPTRSTAGPAPTTSPGPRSTPARPFRAWSRRCRSSFLSAMPWSARCERVLRPPVLRPAEDARRRARGPPLDLFYERQPQPRHLPLARRPDAGHEQERRRGADLRPGPARRGERPSTAATRRSRSSCPSRRHAFAPGCSRHRRHRPAGRTPASTAGTRHRHLPLALLEDAASRFESVMRPHTLAAMLCQSLYEQVRVVAERAGRPLRSTSSRATGRGETDVVADLSDVSRDRLSLDGSFGAARSHGPDEGELASRSWRMRRNRSSASSSPTATWRRSATPATSSNSGRPIGGGRRKRSSRPSPPDAGPRRERSLAIAGRLIPLRGFGKAAFLQCVDVGRSASVAYGEEARRRPACWRTRRTYSCSRWRSPGGPTVHMRRDRARTARDVRALPRRRAAGPWQGMPEPAPVADTADPVAEIVTGAPVSPGVVTGTARLVLDPDADEPLQPSEVLVCRTTTRAGRRP